MKSIYYEILNPKNLRYNIVFCSIICYCLTAIFSVGFHHEDEHYQIIEFAEHRAGHIDQVTWEYGAKIRPSIQPVICLILFKIIRWAGIDDHFTMATVLKLLSGVLSIFIINVFVKNYQTKVDAKFSGIFICFSFLLWFLPYIAVRFSSESFSALFCLLVISKAINLQKSAKHADYLLFGIFAGSAIMLRLQCSALIFGVILWLIIVEKVKISKCLIIAGIMMLTILTGVFIDYLFYGTFTLTAYNYFDYNLVKGVANDFGIEPWYKIFQYTVEGPGPIFGILTFFSLVLVGVFDRKNVLLWAVIPFILIHTISPHKELRFLFTIAFLAPGIIIKGLEIIDLKIASFNNVFSNTLYTILFSLNLIGLLTVCTKSPRNGQTEIAYFIGHKYNAKQINLLCSFDNNPFDPTINYKHQFYKVESLRVTEINSIWDKNLPRLIDNKSVNLLLINNSEYTGLKSLSRLKDLRMVKVKGTDNIFIRFVLGVYGIDCDKQLQLYEYN